MYIRVVAGSPDVARVRISDGAIRAVTATPERPERWPYWSDAAARLVYQVGRTGDPRYSDLVLWDPTTGNETALLTSPDREERWPGWSPDGRWLVFAFRGGRPAAGIALADPDERTVAVIARTGGADFFLRPAFSPDGRLLVAQRNTLESGGSNLWILSAGAPPRRLTGDADWVDTKPWFTRDGSRIVHSRRRREGPAQHDIASIDVAGNDLRVVLATPADEHSARPSPTRDELVIVSDQDGSSDVFLADLDGNDLRVLRRSPEWNELAPNWSPDGERLVVTAVPAALADFGSMTAADLPYARLLVLDRRGNVLLDTPGAMADWMPPWP